MGGSTQKNTSNQQTSTTTQLPEWMTSAGQDLYSKASAQKPLGAYAGQMTAGPAANQTAASNVAMGAVGAGQGDLNTARAMTTAAAGAGPATVSAPQVGAAMMKPATQNFQGYTAAGNGQAPTVQAGSVDAGQFGTAQAEQYMNPWQQLVQATTLRNMDQKSEVDHQALNDNVQGAHAFGGTRQALLESELAKNQGQARTDYINSSNADAYTQAQQQFNTDRAARVAADTGNADRSLQGQTTNASLLDAMMGRVDAANQFTAGAANDAAGANASRQQDASQFNANSRNTVGTDNANRAFDASKTNATGYETMLDRLLNGGKQMGDISAANSNLTSADVQRLASTGAQDQQTQNAGLEAQYNDWLRAGNAPLDNIKDIMAILSGAPRNVTTNGTSSGTSTTKSNPGLLNTLLAAGQVAASAGAFSDPRLKKDVSLIERTKRGLGIFLFRYLWERPDEDLHVGVMADEVARIVPEALGPIVGGYMTVNYAKLGGAL